MQYAQASNCVRFQRSDIDIFSHKLYHPTCTTFQPRFVFSFPHTEDIYTKHEETESQELVIHVMDTCDRVSYSHGLVLDLRSRGPCFEPRYRQCVLLWIIFVCYV